MPISAGSKLTVPQEEAVRMHTLLRATKYLEPTLIRAITSASVLGLQIFAYKIVRNAFHSDIFSNHCRLMVARVTATKNLFAAELLQEYEQPERKLPFQESANTCIYGQP